MFGMIEGFRRFVNYNLSELTPGERFWLWRRRQPSPTGRRKGYGGSTMSRWEAAARFNIPEHSLELFEKGIDDKDIPAFIPQVTDPTTGELCLIARLRSRVTLDELSRELGGLSRPTYNKRELEGDPAIVRQWQRRGFIFPRS